ncbi:MAG: glucosaminidase domain-containing protein [Butyrivibrio sp.]|nr:glucosaminidase domain-containing protein [Butyrivibrio sp.]
MELVESFLTGNPCYAAGRKIGVKGLMLHSVGCPQPRASVFIRSWNRADYKSACVHGFIDALDGKVYQTLPWDYRGWHCGSGKNGSGNDTHIGVEMCEPSCISYVGGAAFRVADGKLEEARACAGRAYRAAVELFAMLCGKFGLDPLGDGVVLSHAEGYGRGIASNHGDPEHLWGQLGLGYTMDGFRGDVAVRMDADGVVGSAEMQAAELKDLSETDVVAKVGALFAADQKKSGILASVSMAQFILESGYGKSELAQNANNVFGMKKSLSGNTWDGSVWDGSSVYTKRTQEFVDGKYVMVTADFRRYRCMEDSVADHSAYLLGAMNGSRKRYEGLEGCVDYREAAQVIKEGGYATSPDYVEKLCSVIERLELTEWDVREVSGGGGMEKKYYRVRKSWADTDSQKGAFTVLDNAKKCAEENPGHVVYDWKGEAVYPSGVILAADGGGMTDADCPFLVEVSIPNLNIRKGVGADAEKTGRCTGVGVFTVVEVRQGRGSEKGWGRLKSGAGWISLDYCRRG